MRVICHDICGIGNDGAIYELVVIWVYRNKIESELGINANRVVCSENCATTISATVGDKC